MKNRIFYDFLILFLVIGIPLWMYVKTSSNLIQSIDHQSQQFCQLWYLDHLMKMEPDKPLNEDYDISYLSLAKEHCR